jgi:hypothetical protein
MITMDCYMGRGERDGGTKMKRKRKEMKKREMKRRKRGNEPPLKK